MSMCESILTIALVCTVKYLHYCDYYYTLGNDSQSTPKLIAYVRTFIPIFSSFPVGISGDPPQTRTQKTAEHTMYGIKYTLISSKIVPLPYQMPSPFTISECCTSFRHKKIREHPHPRCPLTFIVPNEISLIKFPCYFSLPGASSFFQEECPLSIISQYVKISYPSSVTANVTSHCAEGLPSSV